MAKYSVIVTRDTTESCVIEVEAEDHIDARQKVLEKIADNDLPTTGWEQDDTPNASKDPYITGVEEAE